MRWYNWITLFIALLALLLSGYAIHKADVYYKELNKPQTQHEIIQDRLSTLDNKIVQIEKRVSAIGDSHQSSEIIQGYLAEAKSLRNQAEPARDDGKYDEADRLITEASNKLQMVPPPPTKWWLIGGILAGLIAVAVVVWITVIGQRPV